MWGGRIMSIENTMDYETEHEYDYEEECFEYQPDPDWNQCKGFRSVYNPNMARTLFNAIRKLREIELAERQENEKKPQKKAQNESESESEEESAPKAKQTQRPDTKYDPNFPTLSQAVVMQNDMDCEGWKVQKTRVYAVEKKSTEVDTSKTKTAMCESIAKGVVCRHGKYCRYAHSPDELLVQDCKFGKNCKAIHYAGVYCRNNKGKPCMRRHPDESLEHFFLRTGLKKLPPPTEEEMQLAFEEFMKEEPKVQEKKRYSPKTQPWKSFPNVQHVKKLVIVQKPTKAAEVNFEAEKIREKNEITTRIRELNASIKRAEDTIARFRGIRNPSEYYTTQIVKLENENIKRKSEIASLEEKFKAVDERKKQQVKPVITATVVKVAEVIAKPQTQAKPVEKKEATVVLYVPQKKVEVKPVNCWVKPLIARVEKPVEKVEDSHGWIEVKGRNNKTPVQVPQFVPKVRDDGFEVLKDKKKLGQVLTRTKMCTYGKRCNRGDSCRFAHNKGELTVKNCVFGECCKFVENKGGKFVNKGKEKVCEYRHHGEEFNNYYTRIGV